MLDVGLVTKTYLDLRGAGQSPAIENVIAELTRKGFSLDNPIAKNPDLTSYRISTAVAKAASSPILSPSTIVVEETDNISDLNGYVIGLADGSISYQRK